MNRIRVLAIMAGLTAILVAGLSAAQQQQGDTASDPEEQGQTASTGTKSDAGRDAAPTSPAPAKSDDSPYDYRSSEEISEDLSVSFPVDI